MIIIVVAALVVLGVIVWFVRAQHPEQAAGHADTHSDAEGSRYYGNNPPGPAGADAEAQDPDDLGNRRGSPPPP